MAVEQDVDALLPPRKYPLYDAPHVLDHLAEVIEVLATSSDAGAFRASGLLEMAWILYLWGRHCRGGEAAGAVRVGRWLAADGLSGRPRPGASEPFQPRQFRLRSQKIAGGPAVARERGGDRICHADMIMYHRLLASTTFDDQGAFQQDILADTALREE